MHGTQNLDLLRLVAVEIEEIAEEVVFVGGVTVGLLITDEGAADVRPTVDVDVIAEVTDIGDYYQLVGKLQDKGFQEDARDGAPMCRFVGHGVTLDVMPTDETILGFSNKWYPDAIANAVTIELGDGLTIQVVSAPYFLATKLEAFLGRGAGDYMMSHDLEDIIAVIDGREELLDEVAASEALLVAYLNEQFSSLLQDAAFVDALPGMLSPDSGGQARIGILLDRIKRLAGE